MECSVSIANKRAYTYQNGTANAQWKVAVSDSLPFRWPARAEAIPVLGVVFVKKSTLGALMTTLQSFRHPMIIVHLGKIQLDSSLDTFLLTQCGLNVESIKQARPCTFVYREDPIACLLGLFVLRVPLAAELALEFFANNVLYSLAFKHVIFMESGISFREPGDVEWLALSARDTASTCLVEPGQSHLYDMEGQSLSKQAGLFYRNMQERPRALHEHWTSSTDASILPLLCLAKESCRPTVMRHLSASYHPLDQGFGTLASLYPTRLINRGQFKTRLAPGMSCELDILPNKKHVCNMILDRQDWFAEWSRPFLRVYTTMLFFWWHVASLWDPGAEEKLPVKRYGKMYSLWTSLLSFLLNVTECCVNIFDLFVPAIMVIFWIDLMPFLMPLAPWASDALLIAHAFVLRTTVVSWSDLKPWVQYYMHYGIMAFYLILDVSIVVAFVIAWILGTLDSYYRCLAYSLALRILVSVTDSYRLQSKSMLSGKTWLGGLVTLPWIIRTNPVFSMLHLPRKVVPYARQSRKMYTLQESLMRSKTLDWYSVLRTWTVIVWSVANASMLSLQRFLNSYGEYTQRFPAKVFAYGLAVMHVWAAVWVVSDWMRCFSVAIKQRELEFESIAPIKGTKTNPVERKVQRLLRKPYEQRVTGMLAATQGVTQSTTTEQVGSTHRQVQTMVTVGSRMDYFLY